MEIQLKPLITPHIFGSQSRVEMLLTPFSKMTPSAEQLTVPVRQESATDALLFCKISLNAISPSQTVRLLISSLLHRQNSKVSFTTETLQVLWYFVRYTDFNSQATNTPSLLYIFKNAICYQRIYLQVRKMLHAFSGCAFYTQRL